MQLMTVMQCAADESAQSQKNGSHLFRPLCSPSDNKIDITWTQLDPSKIVVFYIDLSPVTSVEPVNLEWETLALVDILVNG